MTHLRIEQNTTGIEEVSASVISKLYDLVHSGTLDNSSNLYGRLHTTATYQDYIDYLTELFDGTNDKGPLYIDATKKYILFADPEVQRVLMTLYGDGTGVTREDMSSVTSLTLSLFKNNTVITSFDELGQFSSIIQIKYDCFYGATNLSSIDLSNIEELGNNAFDLCSLLTSIDLSSCTTINNSAFRGCTGLTTVTLNPNFTLFNDSKVFEGCSSLTTIDLSNITKLRDRTFYNCTSLGTNQTLELNLTLLTTGGYPHSALRGTKYTKLILHSPLLSSAGYDTRYPIYENMTELTYLDLSDWRPGPSVFNNSWYTDCSFYSNNSLVTYIAPINTNYISKSINNLSKISTMRYIILLATTPPEIETADNNNPPSKWFYNKSGNVHIYVPDSAKAAYLADSDWSTIGGYNGSDTIIDRLHGLSELPAGVWTTGLASLYLTPALLATS